MRVPVFSSSGRTSVYGRVVLVGQKARTFARSQKGYCGRDCDERGDGEDKEGEELALQAVSCVSPLRARP
jgi:hypothetical protein